MEPTRLSGGEKIGTGAFGVIERAVLQPNNRRVAVKYVKADVMDGPKPLAQVIICYPYCVLVHTHTFCARMIATLVGEL